MSGADVVVVGAGHNGLACAAYLARRGLEVTVVEAAERPGGCCMTETLPDGRGRIEAGSYEHGAIRGSGVAADLELETRFGLRFHERDEVTLGPCDDGTAIALHRSLEQTLANLEPVVGAAEAARYRAMTEWSTAAMGLLGSLDSGPPPSLRELAALSEAALGAAGRRLMRDLLASASSVLRAWLTDPRLQGVIGHWAAHSQQSPADPGTGAGAFFLPGSHGRPASRPVGGASATVDALVACLQDAGGRLLCATPAEAIEVSGGRAVAVVAGGERIAARRAVVSAIDARRALLDLVGEDALGARLAAEVRAVHTGARNVAELKVDATIAALPEVPGPPGFERAFMLSPNTLGDTERAFAQIEAGAMPDRGPLMIGLPSTLEPGWAPEGRHAIWLSTFVPWRRADGPWDEDGLQAAADTAWEWAQRALGGPIEALERHVIGPAGWQGRTGNVMGCPNHVDMSIDQLLANRPSPSLSGYATPIGGLFLTGAGTHPGGGVSGVPGRNAAAVVLDAVGGEPAGARTRRLRERAALVRDAARAAWSLRRAA